MSHTPSPATAAGGKGRSPRWAAVAFVVMAVGAVAVIRWRSRSQFFFQDEWSVLAGRTLSWESLIEPHWGHCIVLPAIAYRLLFEVFGLTTYAPYQALVIGAHLVVVSCLRAIMVRAGVNPWIVLSACALMLVLGAGQPDVAWGFQVTLTGSVAFALAALVLLDRERCEGDRQGWRRDGSAVLCLVGSVLCSGLGVILLAPIAVVVTVRAGVRRAAAVVAAPAATYGAWLLAAPPSEHAPPSADPARAVGFGARLVQYTILRVGGSPALGWVLFAVLLAGAGATVLRTPWSRFRSRYLTVFVLLASTGPIALAIGRSRAEITTPDAPRYIYLVAALALPALAVALDRLARDRGPLLAAGCLLVIAAVPANIRALAPEPARSGRPILVYALAQQGDRLGIRGDYRPFPTVGSDVTISYLAAAHRTGRTRELPPDHPALEAALLTLALVPMPDVWGLGCPEATPTGSDLRLQVGERFHTQGSPVEISRTTSPAPGTVVTIPAHTTVEVAWGPLDLTPVGAEPVVRCGR